MAATGSSPATAAYSTDGITWTADSVLPVSGFWFSVAFGQESIGDSVSS
jgi:hypothetical protein